MASTSPPSPADTEVPNLRPVLPRFLHVVDVDLNAYGELIHRIYHPQTKLVFAQAYGSVSVSFLTRVEY